VFQMFAHGIMTGLFFALVGLIYEKAHSREIFKMGGFGTMMPGIAVAFTIGGLSSLGLPATAGFVAEFLTFLGAWGSAHSWWLYPGVLGAFLTSIYVLRVAKQIFWGAKSDDPHFQHLPDAKGPEWAAIGILVFVLVLFGVAPSIAIGPVDTATAPLLQRLLPSAATQLESPVPIPR
jgi:NADH-quinone oxidoreductase subunit M